MLNKDFFYCRFFELSPSQKIFIIFSLALVIRVFFLCVVFINVTYLAPDSFDYIRLARNIIENRIYGSPGNPEIFRVPLYPFLLAGFMLIFKTQFVFALLFFQIVLDSITAVFVIKFGNFLFKESSEKIGFTAGILYSLSPLCIVYSTKVLSETVFVFQFLLLLIISLKVVNIENIKANLFLLYLILIGVLAGTLCLTRAIFIPLVGLFLLWFAFRIGKVKYILVVVIFFSLIPGLWIIRNHHVCGYTGITTVSAVNMYRYDACSLLAKIHSISFAKQQSKIDAELSKISTQKEISEYCAKRAFAVIKTHPFIYVYLHCKNSIGIFLPAVNDLFESFGVIMGGKGTLGIIHSSGLVQGLKHYFNNRNDLLLIALPLSLVLFVFYGFALFGIYMVIKKTLGIVADMDHLFILLALIYFFIAGGAAATPRFRVPIEPFLCIYAASGIFFLIKISLFKKGIL